MESGASALPKIEAHTQSQLDRLDEDRVCGTGSRDKVVFIGIVPG